MLGELWLTNVPLPRLVLPTIVFSDKFMAAWGWGWGCGCGEEDNLRSAPPLTRVGWARKLDTSDIVVVGWPELLGLELLSIMSVVGD